MHLKMLAWGKKTKTQHFKMLRRQAFVPEGIKSRRTLLPKAASQSPPRDTDTSPSNNAWS